MIIFIDAMDRLLELSYVAPTKDQFPLQSSSWRNALYDILSTVEANVADNNAIILFRHSKFVCTYDKFPKAKHHLLLMCRNYSTNPSCLMNVKSLNDLTKKHLDELREFHNLARRIAAAISGDAYQNSFKIGYHSIPSLHPLHLHIISSDLDSPCVTTRKHIVSFSSDFFVTADEVENHLESAFVDSLPVAVRAQRAQDVLDSYPLKCQYCSRSALNVPDFKRHNQICLKAKTPNKEERAHNDNGHVQLNSLLGWTSKRDLTQNHRASGRKRSRGDS